MTYITDRFRLVIPVASMAVLFCVLGVLGNVCARGFEDLAVIYSNLSG